MVQVNAVILGHCLLNALKSSYPTRVTKFTETLLNMQHVKSKKGLYLVCQECRMVKVLNRLGVSEVKLSLDVTNPADLPNRGDPRDELERGFWTKDPSFLDKPESEWPKQPVQAGRGYHQNNVQMFGKEDKYHQKTDLGIYFAQLQAEKS